MKDSLNKFISLKKISPGKKISFLFGISVSALAIYWLSDKVDFNTLRESLKKVDLKLTFLAFLFMILSYFLRAYRWPLFFPKTDLKIASSFKLICLGFFMNNILPARMGELVRAHYGGKFSSESRATVFATIAGERLFDSLAISVIFFFGFFGLGLAATVPNSMNLLFVALFFFIAAASIFCAVLLDKPVIRVLRYFCNLLPGKKLTFYAVRKIELFISGLKTMFKPSKFFSISVLSLSVWLLEMVVFAVLSFAFGVQPQLDACILFLASASFSSLVPAAPGGLGVIEAITTSFLTQYGMVPETALSIVIVQHALQYLVVGIPGIYSLMFGIGGEKEEAESDYIESEESPAVG